MGQPPHPPPMKITYPRDLLNAGLFEGGARPSRWWGSHGQTFRGHPPGDQLTARPEPPRPPTAHAQDSSAPFRSELGRFFFLDAAARELIASKRRGTPNRLGLAVQLTTVRCLGVFLDDP